MVKREQDSLICMYCTNPATVIVTISENNLVYCSHHAWDQLLKSQQQQQMRKMLHKDRELGITEGRVYAVLHPESNPQEQEIKARQAAGEMQVRDSDAFISGWNEGYNSVSQIEVQNTGPFRTGSTMFNHLTQDSNEDPNTRCES